MKIGHYCARRSPFGSSHDEIPLALNVLTIAIASNNLSNIDLVQQQSSYGIQRLEYLASACRRFHHLLGCRQG